MDPKLLSSGIELYKPSTGTTLVSREPELVAAEVVALTSKLSLEQDLDVGFQKICDKTTNLAEEILARLEKLKVNGEHRAWRSLRQAINTAWTRDELAALMARLSTLRETFESSILVSLRYSSAFRPRGWLF
ncbi:MAG: hypothetical protein M1813_003195 [Trichoglossum hirsutum]|nr:MAG: hypothetical protein M1813_003195 [Trichoglossum hirsutum]